MSKVSPSRALLMGAHSICHPGRPFPQGLSHAGSPGLADFHKAKSPGERFLEPAAPPSPCCSSAESLLSLPYCGLRGTSKNTSPSAAYAKPLSINDWVNLIIPDMCSVALGM